MEPLFLKYENYIECRLCPHFCKIAQGKVGICGVRKNTGEKIELMTYGIISGYSLDPVEKKPLYHFFPGRNILSIGSYGCNMRCDFCQNWHISQKPPDHFTTSVDQEKIINDAVVLKDNVGLAFTYNEPVIWFEFVRDMSLKMKEVGLHTVMVTNGFVNKDPLTEIIEFTDAFNIDLKAFNHNFYKRLTGAELEPVKNTLKQVSKAGRHLEITTLIIPGWNEDEKEMEAQAEWIANELGPETPLHISRYFPMYKRDDPATSHSSLESVSDSASKYLKYVYLGNSNSGKGQNTVCSKCGTIVTFRSGYNTRITSLDSEGNCLKCGNRIYRSFIPPSVAGRSV